jgi:hypothetical protein
MIILEAMAAFALGYVGALAIGYLAIAIYRGL